jgi:hypothetical protein
MVMALFATTMSASLITAQRGNNGGPNIECPAGTEQVSKFEWTSGGYAYDGPAGNQNVVQISGNEVSGNWTSSEIITHVILKGSTGTYTYDANSTSGSFSKNDLPLNNGGQRPDISNIQFCGNGETPTPTDEPTEEPTDEPTDAPTDVPTEEPTQTPAPAAVRPILECVANNGDGTYTARFGYLNENASVINIPVGAKNKFTPQPENRGQTTDFQPGRVMVSFEVVFNGSNLVWTLNGPNGQTRTATASSGGSKPCATLQNPLKNRPKSQPMSRRTNPPANLHRFAKQVMRHQLFPSHRAIARAAPRYWLFAATLLKHWALLRTTTLSTLSRLVSVVNSSSVWVEKSIPSKMGLT